MHREKLQTIQETTSMSTQLERQSPRQAPQQPASNIRAQHLEVHENELILHMIAI